MGKFRFANRASALVTVTVDTADTTVSLESGAGAFMPTLTGDDTFRATLIAVDGTVEIVTCTGMVGDVATVIRGQEGTPAGTFASGSRFEVRMTAGVAGNFVQRTGDTMLGSLDMAGNQLLRPNFAGAPVRFGTFHATYWRAESTPLDQVYTPAENAIYIPSNINANFDARRPGYMGRVIPNTQMFDGVVFNWYGDVNALPSHMKLCDGTQGTPDLRGLFILGWQATFGVGGTGGATTFTTDPAGAHSHGGGTVGTQLVPAHMPPLNIFKDIRKVESGNDDNVLWNMNVAYTGAGAPHAHPINIDGNHQHLIQGVLPPFYVLARVMFKV